MFREVSFFSLLSGFSSTAMYSTSFLSSTSRKVSFFVKRGCLFFLETIRDLLNIYQGFKSVNFIWGKNGCISKLKSGFLFVFGVTTSCELSYLLPDFCRIPFGAWGESKISRVGIEAPITLSECKHVNKNIGKFC